jgi:outer membrane protein assembly complex protein YaeT
MAAKPASDAQSSPAEPYAGRTVVSVRVEIEGQVTTDATLADLVESRAGAPLVMAEVRESIGHLFSLRRFENVEVHAEPAPAGVALRYNLIPLHIVERIDFRGDLGLSEGDLRRHVTERFGATPAPARADAAARAVEQFLKDRGFLRASVKTDLETRHDPDRTIMIMGVEAGPRAVIGEVTFQGVEPAERAELVRRLDLHPGGAFDPTELDRRMEERERALRRQSYYEARISRLTDERDDGRTVDVAVSVARGPLVRVVFEGDSLPDDRVDDLVPIEREGSADLDLVEDSERRILAYLNGQGYWKAQVSADRVERGDELLIVFLVNRGPKYVVDTVEISGNAAVPIARLLPLVQIKRGEPFVASLLAADEAAIMGLYRTEGFASASVIPAVVEVGEPVTAGVGRLSVTFAIAEGVRTAVGAIELVGNATVAEGELRAAMRVRPGDGYYDRAIAADREAVLQVYLNRGYQQAVVSIEPRFSEDRRSADLRYRINEGPLVIVDHILVVGNRRTREETIRAELLVRSGEPLGFSQLYESRRRLSVLGLFRRIQIDTVAHGASRVDLIVTVEETDPTTIGYGGGLEADTLTVLGPDGLAEDRIEVAPRGFFEIGRRNLGGKNRSLNFSTRVSFRRKGETFDPTEGGGYGFNEYRVLGTYREPRLFRTRFDGSIVAFAEQAIRTTFNFRRIGLNADVVRAITPTTRVNGRYSIGRTVRFDERIPPEDEVTIDRLFPEVRLSSFGGALFHDTRDDLLDPSRGSTQGVDVELAAKAIGSQVGFVKMFGQASIYRLVRQSPRVVLAGAAKVGLASGFDEVLDPDPPPGCPALVREIPASERFFAGGSTTVRGFAQDKLGAPCTISPQDFPLGGNALVVLNLETRARVLGPVDLAGFVDAGNVFERAADFSIGEMRASVGFGLRYNSPIGPIRVDLGFKLRRRELTPGRFEDPMAFHLSVGQAF